MSSELFTDLAVFTVNWGINNLMVPGRVENWAILVDVGNISTYKIPVKQVSQVLKSMQTLYRGRLFHVFVINMPMLGYAVWKIVKNFISQYTLDKINVERSTFDALHKEISLN